MDPKKVTRHIAALVVLCIASGALLGSAQQQTCHLRELDLCAAGLLVLTQAPGGLATSDQEINKQCGHLKEADGCMRNYTRRCLTPIQRELFSMATNSTFQMVGEYCTKGSQLRLGYLKHSQCLNQVQKKEQKSCMRDLQSALELFSSGTKEQSSKRVQLACCTYRRFEACLGGQLERKCGKDTLQWVGETVRRLTARLPETLCRQYRPDGQECKALLPKPGSQPKGTKSNSILSRLLSAYTGL